MKMKKRLLHSAEFLIQYSGGLYYRREFTENVRREQLTYLGYITIIVTSITVLFGVFMIWFMQHNVLGPLNAMSKAASSYSIAILRDGKESPISRMNIRTGMNWNGCVNP